MSAHSFLWFRRLVESYAGTVLDSTGEPCLSVRYPLAQYQSIYQNEAQDWPTSSSTTRLLRRPSSSSAGWQGIGIQMTVDFVIRHSSTGELQAAVSPFLGGPGSSRKPGASRRPRPCCWRPRSGLVLEAEPEGLGRGSGADPPNGPKARTP